MNHRKRSALAVVAAARRWRRSGAWRAGERRAPVERPRQCGRLVGGRRAEAYKPPTITLGTAADSKGPAIPPEGAVKGGTVNMLDRDDFAHLDPAQIYVNTDANFGRSSAAA